MSRPRLYLNHATDLDKLSAIEFGRVDDCAPAENFRPVTAAEDFAAWFHDGAGGPCLGFCVRYLEIFDRVVDEIDELWEPSDPRFDAPQIGLHDATAGEIYTAARAHFDGEPSYNRVVFNAAVKESGEEALALWRLCLEVGDSMAHFALGYTLLELNRPHEAYAHLRYYTEISPANGWNWCWFARAATAIGELTEAREALQRALTLEEETDASELLEALED